MAYIPDEAVDRNRELSAGGWRLYTFLARCRNQENGKCFPSVALTMDAIGVNRGSVYALRKELAEKKWATFEGDNVSFLYGFKSLKNQTNDAVNKGHKRRSLKNQTIAEKSEKSDSQSLNIQTVGDANNRDNDHCLITGVDYQTQSMNNQTPTNENKGDSGEFDRIPQEIREHFPEVPSLKNQTEKSEKSDSESEKSDLHIGRTSKYEPAKEPAKEYMSNSPPATSTAEAVESPPEKIDSRAVEIRQVFDHWKTRLNHPKARLDEKRKKAIRGRLADGYSVAELKTAIDGCRASPFHQGSNDRGKVFDDLDLICRDAKHVEQFIAVVEIPANGNGHDSHNGVTRYGQNQQIPKRETQGARRARETLEYIAGLTRSQGEAYGADPDDPAPACFEPA